jgi:electron transfer flavoprotein alpha/beta subunit
MGKPRIPSGWGIINAAKKPITSWAQNDLGVDPGKVSGRNPLLNLYASSNERNCELITGKNTEEAAGKLADVIATMTGK